MAGLRGSSISDESKSEVEVEQWWDVSFPKPKALKELAKVALARKTGARGLRAEMEKLMTDVMYEAPGNAKMKKVVVTPKMIRERLG